MKTKWDGHGSRKKKPEDPGTCKHSIRESAEKKNCGYSWTPSQISKGRPRNNSSTNSRCTRSSSRRKAEELIRAHIALEESRDRYLDLYEFAPAGYLTLNDKALITEANLTGARLLGVERSELVNHGFGRFIAPTDHEILDRYFVNVMNKGEKQICTLTLMRSDGSVFPARMEGIRTKGRGMATTVHIAIRDITDIWQIEVLRESEERFHAMFERHDSVMLLIEPETGNILDANIAAERFYGRPLKELRSISIDEINVMSPGEIDAEMMKAA
ncbi:MAG: PAS domain S-box protein [Methanomicrobiales archaeon]|nr:PAS domain S-box protein [Methanomicrobiales archaeon]